MKYNKKWIGIISLIFFIILIIGMGEDSKNIISNFLYPLCAIMILSEALVRLISWIMKKTKIKRFYNKIWFWIIVIIAFCIFMAPILCILMLYLIIYWYHWIYFEYRSRKISKTPLTKKNKQDKVYYQYDKEPLHNNDDANDRLKNMSPKEELNAIALNELEHVDDLTGFAFEKYVAKLLLRCGYDNAYNTVKQGDFGIDVIATKNHIKYGFQCKLYKNSVGYKAIQETLAGGEYYHIKKCIVITNRRFTKNAKKAAKSFGIDLWNRNDLKQLIIKSYDK